MTNKTNDYNHKGYFEFQKNSLYRLEPHSLYREENYTKCEVANYNYFIFEGRDHVDFDRTFVMDFEKPIYLYIIDTLNDSFGRFVRIVYEGKIYTVIQDMYIFNKQYSIITKV